MIYFANPCGAENDVTRAMQAGLIGYIATPAQTNVRPPGVVWCADNGCFGKGYPGDAGFLEWLRRQPGKDECVFAVAPDVVGDAAATWERARQILPLIRRLGYQVAYTAQDGLTFETAPWHEFDVLFVGGTTEWKLGPEARWIVRAAKKRGRWVHMGRVNSRQRYRYAEQIGCDSVDGTFLTFGPIKNMPRLKSWLREIPLFGGIA
jgi:hypothetical protein